ncbi:cyclin-like protein [Backusella circina FSU 941]|nr:cyclin-like protein [Backusella circina FSU 941]
MDSDSSKVQSKPPIYEESSQFKHWRFSPDKLWEIRKANVEAAINRVKQNLQEELDVNHEDKTKEYNFLSAEEELALCRFYEKQLQAVCTHMKFTEMVMATGVIYMKRFFLYNDVMDYHPKDIFLTCLFLATKSESERIPIDEFGEKLRLPSTSSILNLEFTVSQGLKFQYYVHHPYRPAYGFFLDMQNGPTDIKLLKETYKQVNSTIAELLLTDLPLIYQPAQLALAAFMIPGKGNGFDVQVIRYIEERFPSTDASQLLLVIKKIIASFKSVKKIVTTEEARAIDYRLRICMNPATNPESSLYKKRLAEKAEEEEQRRKKLKTSSSSSSSSLSSDQND